jgi:hypothetical protein
MSTFHINFSSKLGLIIALILEFKDEDAVDTRRNEKVLVVMELGSGDESDL